jgi:hypothetical protein
MYVAIGYNVQNAQKSSVNLWHAEEDMPWRGMTHSLDISNNRKIRFWHLRQGTTEKENTMEHRGLCGNLFVLFLMVSQLVQWSPINIRTASFDLFTPFNQWEKRTAGPTHHPPNPLSVGPSNKRTAVVYTHTLPLHTWLKLYDDLCRNRIMYRFRTKCK